MNKFSGLLFVLGIFGGLRCAHAASSVTLRGFGTAAAQKLSTSYNMPDINNTGRQVDLRSLSRFGTNLHADFDEKFSVASQFLAAGKGDTYRLTLDWGFLSWSASSALSVRAGRVIIPVWLYSQQIDVGYTYPWVAPPNEVYGLNPLKSINGLSVLGRARLGRGLLQAEIVGGENRTTITNDVKGAEAEYDIRVSDFLGADLTYTLEELLTLRVAYNQATLNAEVDTRLLLPAGTITGVPVNTVALVPTVLDANRARFLSFGLKSEYENIFLISEFARSWIRGTALAGSSGYYATMGRRWHHLTPYGVYAWRGSLSGTLRPHPLAPAVTTLLEKISTWGGGLDYQVHENVVIKAEVLHSNYAYQDASRAVAFNRYLSSVDFIF